MLSTLLKLLDPISTLPLVNNFKTVCYWNCILEGATVRLFQQFIKDPGRATLGHKLCATEDDDSQKVKELATGCQFVNYQLATYIIDDVMAEAEAKTKVFKPPE